jgi:hypothetical protein
LCDGDLFAVYPFYSAEAGSVKTAEDPLTARVIKARALTSDLELMGQVPSLRRIRTGGMQGPSHGFPFDDIRYGSQPAFRIHTNGWKFQGSESHSKFILQIYVNIHFHSMLPWTILGNIVKGLVRVRQQQKGEGRPEEME